MTEMEMNVDSNELGVFYPSEQPDLFKRKEENLETENRLVERLLQQKKATVFHRIQSEEDFESIQNMGVIGNYRLKTDEGTKHFAYFSILHPTEVDGTRTAITLNENEKKFRIFDNRSGLIMSPHKLVEDGYDGSIEIGGIGTAFDQRYMLRLFDGESLAGMFKKVAELDRETH